MAIDTSKLTLPAYLAMFPELTQDLDHWAEYGITTADQLGDYLDGCVVREERKSAFDYPELAEAGVL